MVKSILCLCLGQAKIIIISSSYHHHMISSCCRGRHGNYRTTMAVTPFNQILASLDLLRNCICFCLCLFICICLCICLQLWLWHRSRKSWPPLTPFPLWCPTLLNRPIFIFVFVFVFVFVLFIVFVFVVVLVMASFPLWCPTLFIRAIVSPYQAFSNKKPHLISGEWFNINMLTLACK